MKKVTLFMADSDQDANLTRLGKLGVLHITPFQPAEDESIDRIQARIKQMETAIDILNRYQTENAEGKTNDVNDFANTNRGEIKLMEKVLQTDADLQKLDDEIVELEDAKTWYQSWGNVTKDDLAELAHKGYFLKMYIVSAKEVSKIKDRNDITVVGEANGVVRVLLMTEDKGEKLPFYEYSIPEVHYSEVEKKIAETREQIEACSQTLKALSLQKVFLEDALKERIKRFEVRNVQYSGISFEGQVRYWKGYIPEEQLDNFTSTAAKHHWGYMIEDAGKEEEEDPPTLIKSPKWADRIRPVLNFMGLVPGYDEIDVSRVFLLFFTFFTGILVGDAGYGLVFLLLTLFVHSKAGFKRKVEFQLIYTLSVSILFWGVISGTYFGSELIAGIPFLNMLIVDKLASFGGDSIFLQKFMFIVGAIHLTVGHLQSAWKSINSVRAIAQIGWISIVWGLYFVVGQMVLGIPAPSFVVWLFVGGAALIAFFSKPSSNFFKGVLSSIGNLPLSIINGFSDIISYIRLYAVGLATVLMAESFNQMAIGDGIDTVASGIGAVIVLILGHALNMILAAMAVIVHGVRLNMLEYAGHAGVEFSGSEYKPFQL
ncbi:MAG TPA: hypothetical protein VJ951_15505 [Bacteroidales bacterium]|nr:hypothetical protein [Bacteroidales bacterium]